MNKRMEEFKKLSALFKEHGFIFLLVGGTVRDFLLTNSVDDMDAVTDATPEDMKLFIPDASYTFSKMGSVRYKSNEIKFDITTLREEKNYKDSRHPMEVKFVKDPKIDVFRRDFTVNALYMNEHFQVLDYVNGVEDLNKKVIKMIGNPNKRLQEDPLRILRAIRFAIDLNFELDTKLKKSIGKNINLLKKIKVEKLKEDINKINNKDSERKNYYFDKFHIMDFINVVE